MATYEPVFCILSIILMVVKNDVLQYSYNEGTKVIRYDFNQEWAQHTHESI